MLVSVVADRRMTSMSSAFEFALTDAATLCLLAELLADASSSGCHFKAGVVLLIGGSKPVMWDMLALLRFSMILLQATSTRARCEGAYELPDAKLNCV
jgi:hypothetical protein